MLIRSFLFIAFALLFNACRSNKEISRSFYYWKPSFEIDGSELKLLKSLRSDKLFLKLVTVQWDTPRKGVKIDEVNEASRSGIPIEIEVVPVVMISNEVFLKLQASELKDLANRLLVRTIELADSAGLAFRELQIDCSWSAESKDSYFAFLKFIKSELDPISQRLSCTIRLKQIKSPYLAGIPPVDRGMLIYYNTGNVEEPGTRNSIYDADVAARYVSSIKNYRLPLDLALPVFTWAVHQRNGNVLSVIQNVTLEETRSSGMFQEKAKGLFVPLSDCFFKGSFFKEADRLRVEEISPRKSLRAAKQVQPFLNSNEISVALFHLDSVNTNRYGQEAFDKLYSVFE